MTLQDRVNALVKLGERLQEPDEYLQAVIHRTYHNNQWFVKENQELAIKTIANEFLEKSKLNDWLASYPAQGKSEGKKVGLVLAGNIPLVGFHDVLCTFVAGHHARIKLSDKDKFLLPCLVRMLGQIDERSLGCFTFVEKLKDYDAVIATGSNNSARYFEAYFGKYPNIIRKNRNGVAVLNGQESAQELHALGQDVFQYFGLGCRNVSKLYLPEGYSFEPLLEAFHGYNQIILNDKYKNNFDYNYAIFVLNKVEYKANGCIILTENKAIASHIAGLHFEYYAEKPALERELETRKEEIQCIVAQDNWLNQASYSFGQAQQPALEDYADGVDTMQFLLNL